METINLYDLVETLIDKTECGKTTKKGTLGTVLEMKTDSNGKRLYLVEIDSKESILLSYRDGEIKRKH